MSLNEEKGLYNTHACGDFSSRENSVNEDPEVGPCWGCLRNGAKDLRATRFMDY